MYVCVYIYMKYACVFTYIYLYTQNGILLNHKIMKFWHLSISMGLEGIMLSEISQRKKNTI